MSIDWSKPIEAVYHSGKVVPASPYNGYHESWPDDEGQYHINADNNLLFANEDGSPYFKDSYHIRNVVFVTPPMTDLSPETVGKLVALVRRAAAGYHISPEAAAIVAELPKLVDPVEQVIADAMCGNDVSAFEIAEAIRNSPDALRALAAGDRS